MRGQIRGDIRSPQRSAFAMAAILLLVLLFLPSAAYAHKVNVFAYVAGDMVVTESYFNDGRRCQDSVIEVFDGTGKKLLEGKTNTGGQFSFRPPARTDLLIRLTAAMGHQAEYAIPAADLPGAPAEGLAAAPGAVSERAEDMSKRISSGATEEQPQLRAPAATSDIEVLVERAVARQLAPIRRDLEESRNRQRFSDIVGGIGYIIGLMGLVLYFHARRRK
jgi:nickel transport protein